MSDDDGNLLLTGARVYTGDRAMPWAEAIAIRSGTVVYVGSEREAQERAGPACTRIHVPGGLAVPGLNDSHIHLSYGARTLSLLALKGIETVPELQTRLRDFARQHPDREWIEAFGLSYETFAGSERPERTILDDALSDRPVFVRAYDYHSAWCNREALRRAGLERGVADSDDVVTDPSSGLATGMLKEHAAMSRVTSLMPEWSTGELDDALVKATGQVNTLGITSVQNMDGDRDRLEQYERIEERGALTVRASHYLRFPQEELLGSLPELLELGRRYNGPRNRAAGLKLFIDGVVESKTAWMMEPYIDGTGDVGMPVMDPDLYTETVLVAHRLGIDVATHAIGDRAVRVALDSYAAARSASGPANTRHRIEHIEVVSAADIGRFHSLNVTASMQPHHASPAADPHLAPWNVLVGSTREPTAFAWRDLLERGATLAFGSDWPIDTADVRLGIHVAVGRTNRDSMPRGGWQPQQCLTLAQVLDAYTRGAAFAERQERVKGVLCAGMAADVTVFARDLFALTREEICDVPVVATIVGGIPVHRTV